MRKATLIVGFVVLCFDAFGQNLTFYGLLPALNHTGRISKKINYNIFLSTTIDAFDEKIKNVEYPATDLQFYVQPGIIYVHSPRWNFAGSYTYQRNNPFNGNFVNEHRLWQQVVFSIPLPVGKITQRVRVEERFIENRVTGNYPYSTRLRYQLGFNRPLQGRTIEKNEFYFNAYNECYFSVTGARNALYSENWTYAALGYDLGKLGRLESGALMQVAVRNKKQDLRFLNLVQVSWITNMNFRKPKQAKPLK